MVFPIIFLLRHFLKSSVYSETDFLIILFKKVKLKNNNYDSNVRIKFIIDTTVRKSINHFLFDEGG
ncbi:MAG: hypothetical protein AMJ60_08270 [Desulfobacterales bacterium SG8_35]|nr:MAG: hypothetical protein AMJ60_08270 [Desulfobacterales bacterium SG8_35]